MKFNLAGTRVSIDVPHALFVSAMMGYCAWYLHDARANSQDFVDLLLIQPVSIVLFIVYLFILREAVTVQRIGTPAAERSQPSNPLPTGERKPLSPLAARRIIGSMLLLVLYVSSLNWIGFDIATAAYVAASLLLLGERRWWVVVVVPVVFCVICIYLFNSVLQMPLPLSLRFSI